MEKNKLRFAFAVFWLLFSFVCVFAQDNIDADDGGNKETVIEEAANNENNPVVSGDLEALPDRTESIVTEEKNKKNTNITIGYFLWDNIDLNIAGIFLLVIATLIVFLSYLFSRKLIHKEIDNLKLNIEKTINIHEQKCIEKYDSQINRFKSSSNVDDLHDKFGILEEKISRIQNDLNILVELKNKVDKLYYGKKITESITSGNLGVTEAFNLWAASPYRPLPEAFYYIEGEINIRTKREIRESAEETKWITNRHGAKKYLFPNPNSFNQMTNIMELYKMDQAKLKGRGQNKIRIITPCEMTKDGFVEFAGELELL